MENYLKYKLVGGILKLKKGVIPHKFHCQKNTKEIILKPAYVRKRRKGCFGKVLSKDIPTSSSIQEPEFVDCGRIKTEIEPTTLPSDIPIRKCVNMSKLNKCIQVNIKVKTHNASTNTTTIKKEHT